MFVSFPEGIKDKDRIRIAKGKMETEERVYIYPITDSLAIVYSQEEKGREESYLKVGRLIRKALEKSLERLVIIAQVSDTLYVVIKKGETINTYTIPKKEDAFAILSEDAKKVEPEVIYVSGDEDIQRWANEFFMTMNVTVADAKVEEEDHQRVIRERNIGDELKERVKKIRERLFPSISEGDRVSLPSVDKRVALLALVAGIAVAGGVGYKFLSSKKKPEKMVKKKGPDYTNYYKNLAVWKKVKDFSWGDFYLSYDGKALYMVSPFADSSYPVKKVGRVYVKTILVSPAKVRSKPKQAELPPLGKTIYYTIDKGCTIVLQRGRLNKLKKTLKGALLSNAQVTFTLSCSGICSLELKVCGR